MTEQIVSARWILTCVRDRNTPEMIEDSAVLVSGGVIREFGSVEELQRLADVLELDITDLLAFLGVKPVMPEPRVYFRRKFGMDADQAEILANLVAEFQAKQPDKPQKEES